MLGIVAAAIASPVVVIVTSILDPTPSMWTDLWQTRLPGMIVDTTTLLVTVVTGTLLLGAALAWLVTAYEFPGRRIFAWLFVVPLAIPGYVAGFVWLDTLSGPLGARGVRSIWLCAAALTLTLYPYVYLFARAAFRSQGSDARDAARTLGIGPVQSFFRVALPTARPALAAGATLVMMEVLTDVGTVRLFNVSTVADGVLRVWYATGNRDSAAELATTLIGTALLLIALERGLRGSARFGRRAASRPMTAIDPGPSGRATAFGAAMAVVSLAVGVPLIRLIDWSLEATAAGSTRTAAGGLWHHASSTLIVALAATATCIGLGTLLAILARRRGTAGRVVGRAASLGYAMPGPVVAVGTVITLAALDRSGIVPTNFVFVGSIAGLVFALTVRFLAVALQGVESGLDRVPPSTIASARMLGARPSRIAWAVELPAARASIVAAGALLLIDLMKELPITLLLRPFGFDSLAVWVWQATSESLWAQAALPSLTMVVVGMFAIGALLVALDRGAEVVS